MLVRPGLRRDPLHATRQRVQSPVTELAASKLAPPITRRNNKGLYSLLLALQCSVSAFGRILVLYYMLVTGRIIYAE